MKKFKPYFSSKVTPLNLKKRPKVSVNVQIVITFHKKLMICFRYIKLIENKYLDIRTPQSMRHKISYIWSNLQTRFGKLFSFFLDFFPKLYSKYLPYAIFNGLISPHDSLYFNTLGMSLKPIEFLVI